MITYATQEGVLVCSNKEREGGEGVCMALLLALLPSSQGLLLVLSYLLGILGQLARDLRWIRQDGGSLTQLLQTVHDN